MKSIPVSPLLAALLFAFGIGSAASAAADGASPVPAAFYVANWNVENLYDTLDDPDNDGDDEFLPHNPVTRWTRERYETKLDNLAQVISGMNKGQGPDILGIEEVENEDVIRDLVDKLEGPSYGIVHVDSPDPRGIDTAMIFNRNHFSLLESHAYKVSLKWNHTTRDILHAVFEDHDGQKLHVFVNHWPSRGGGVRESEANRFEAARVLALATDRLFQREPAARVVILGDFNDEPSNRSIRDVLDVDPYFSRTDHVATNLYNLSAAKSAKGQGSFSHSFAGETEWRMYDQIIVSGALLESTDIEPDQDLFRIDRPKFMVEERGRDKGAPVPTFENQEFYQGGYSDHFPVGARFVYLDLPESTPEAAPAKAEPPAAASAAPAQPVPDKAPATAAPKKEPPARPAPATQKKPAAKAGAPRRAESPSDVVVW
ncbi:MAG: endonuclease/exonuclease/phosphatase family protein [Kiritimatiellia bacterium]